jgi:gliding motility-associated-like protein
MGFLFTGFNIMAQNLIINGSFEQYLNVNTLTCYASINHCYNWYSFTGVDCDESNDMVKNKCHGSPDYLVQNKSCTFYPTEKFWPPPHGNALVLLRLHQQLSSDIWDAQNREWKKSYYLYLPTHNFRNYMGTYLSQPLQKGKIYSFSFYYTTVNSKDIFVPSRAFMVNFSTYLPRTNNELLLPLKVHWRPAKNLMADTWTRIQFYFMADSAYKYINFGNFLDDSLSIPHTPYDTISGYTTNTSWPTVYLDSFSLYPATWLSKINGKKDVCKDEVAEWTVNWGDSTVWTVKNSGKFLSKGNKLTQSFAYSQWIMATLGPLSDSFFVVVDTLPPIGYFKDTSMCSNETITLSAFSGIVGVKTHWNLTDTSLRFTTNAVNQILVKFKNLSCTRVDTINIIIKSLPTFACTQSDTICNYDSTAYYIACLPANNAYYWVNTGQTANILYNRYNAYEKLKVVGSNGCFLDTSIQVVYTCIPTCYIPTAFTPDGDGLNEYWAVSTSGINIVSIKIYNRLEQLVFESTGHKPRWDGTCKGKLIESGVYLAVVTLEPNTFGSRTLKRPITLLK